MTSWELQEETELANLFKRPKRYYIYDMPYYPYFPNKPTEHVCFDLNFSE